MSAKVLDQISSYVTPELVSKISSVLGESENGISRSIAAAIPSLLGGLIKNSKNHHVMDGVMGLMQESKGIVEVLDFSSLLQDDSSEKNLGSRLLHLIFGNKINEVSELVAGSGSIEKSSATSLLKLMGPVVLGHFSKNALSPSGLKSVLSSEKDSILIEMPVGLASVLNLGEINKEVSTEYKEKSKKNKLPNWLMPLLLLIAAVVIVCLFLRRCTEKTIAVDKIDSLSVKVDTVIVKTEKSVNTAWEKLGAFFVFRLPNGVQLNAPKNGIENQIVTWMNDDSKEVDKTTWFNFDRLLFETGKSTLTPDSQEQLKNIVEIMKAFPGMEIKLGGYTDNTGDAAYNLKLSDERAKSVMNELVALGIASKRISSEGYGNQFPVASNDTEEGRAQNRRISIRITKK